MSYPLHNIHDILASIRKFKYFTCLDMKSGYYQVIMLSEEDAEKTAFGVQWRGLFQFNRMPFGVAKAPALFQSMINRVL